MGAIVSSLLVVALAALCAVALHRQEVKRRQGRGPSGQLEYRTALALDECMDAMAARSEADEFVYEFTRERDGGWLLHLTLHQPTQQPLDTLYVLRMDPGKQTVLTLLFIREAFGSREPVFPQEMMDRFMQQKLGAVRRV